MVIYTLKTVFTNNVSVENNTKIGAREVFCLLLAEHTGRFIGLPDRP